MTGVSTISNGSIVSSGLALYLDAGDAASYSGSGTTWTDLSGSGRKHIASPWQVVSYA